MFTLLLVFLLREIFADTVLRCSNQTITLGKVTNPDNNPSWLLPGGSYAEKLNCLYQINIPKYYSAEVTVEFSGFLPPNVLSIADIYGSIVSSSDGDGRGNFSLEFPYPLVSVIIITGSGDNSTQLPNIGNFLIRSIEHQPFDSAIMAPLSIQNEASFKLVDVRPDLDPIVWWLGDLSNGTSLMFKSNNDPNITLHTLYFSSCETKIQLVNIHIYTYDDLNPSNFYVMGTLFAPQILSDLKKQAICLFISKAVFAEIFLTVTIDQNTASYKNWGLTYALAADRPVSEGPTICLDATKGGPVAQTVFSNLKIFDVFHKADSLTNLIITNITSLSETTPVIEFYTTFPQDLQLMRPAYTFTGDPNELPQKMYGNKQTFVIQSGSACISTNFNAIESGWNIARPKRKGFVIAQTPNVLGPLMTKEFHFFSANGTTNHAFNFTLNMLKSASEGGRCDMNFTFFNQTTSSPIKFNYSDPTARRSLSYHAERVDAVIRPAIGGAIWIDFEMGQYVPSSFSSRNRCLLWITVLFSQF